MTLLTQKLFVSTLWHFWLKSFFNILDDSAKYVPGKIFYWNMYIKETKNMVLALLVSCITLFTYLIFSLIMSCQSISRNLDYPVRGFTGEIFLIDQIKGPILDVFWKRGLSGERYIYLWYIYLTYIKVGLQHRMKPCGMSYVLLLKSLSLHFVQCLVRNYLTPSDPFPGSYWKWKYPLQWNNVWKNMGLKCYVCSLMEIYIWT